MSLTQSIAQRSIALTEQALVTVVVPAFGRPAELHRALVSVAEQSYKNFECLVVDDASPASLSDVVRQLNDSRFVYVRRESNGGPSAARASAYARSAGEYVVQLDSDWEFYPWAIERAVNLLGQHPSADIAVGLHVRHEDSRLFVRLERKKTLVYPEMAVQMPRIPDRVAVVRRSVMETWGEAASLYFALEVQQWARVEAVHVQIAVDEPWVRYHTGAEGSVTREPSVAARQGELNDYVRIVTDEGLQRIWPSRNIDQATEEAFVRLLKARHRGVAAAFRAMRRRRLSIWSALSRALIRKLRPGPPEGVVWVSYPAVEAGPDRARP